MKCQKFKAIKTLFDINIIALREAEEKTGSETEEMIRFHQVHDSNIVLLHDDTIARKKMGKMYLELALLIGQ